MILSLIERRRREARERAERGAEDRRIRQLAFDTCTHPLRESAVEYVGEDSDETVCVGTRCSLCGAMIQPPTTPPLHYVPVRVPPPDRRVRDFGADCTNTRWHEAGAPVLSALKLVARHRWEMVR